MCFIDLDPCEVWVERDRKARKEHVCHGCKRTIRVGETYLSHFDVFEGQPTSQKCCRECAADREEFAKEHDGMMGTPSRLLADLHDCLGEGDNDAAWQAMIARIKARKGT